MKKFPLFFVLLTGTAFSLNAQSWFQNNPHWANYFSFGFQGPGYEHVTVEADTNLQGQPAVVLRRFHDMTYANDFVDYRIMRQQGDTVWAWNAYNHQFYIHYNFSLAVGDSVSGPLYWGGGQFKYYIDSIGTLSVEGQPLRFQQVHFPSNIAYYQCKALIIETIGFVNGTCINTNLGYQSKKRTHLLADEPNQGVVDGPEWLFCRYYNDLLNYNDLSGGYCTALTSQEEPSGDLSSFRILPNPFHDAFSVLTKEDQATSYLRMFDAGGRLVLQTASLSGTISTTALPPGLYFLEITSKTGNRQFCKAIKE